MRASCANEIGLHRVAPDVVSTFALSRTSGSTPTKAMASLGSLDKPAFPRSRGPVSPPVEKDVLARMSARDISHCAMQSSNWLVLCTYNAVTAAKSAQARTSRKSGRAIERRRRRTMRQIKSGPSNQRPGHGNPSTLLTTFRCWIVRVPLLDCASGPTVLCTTRY